MEDVTLLSQELPSLGTNHSIPGQHLAVPRFFAPPKISKKKSLFPRKCEEILKTYPPRQEKTNDKFEKLNEDNSSYKKK